MLRKKRKDTSESMVRLRQESDELYDKAEKSHKMALFLSANSLRKAAGEKESKLKEFDAVINEKEHLMKNTM